MLSTWNELQKRRIETINHNSQSTAILCSLIENIASSFGDNPTPFDPKKFLPIRLPEENLENKLRELIKPKTLKILKRLYKKKLTPAHIVRDFKYIEGLYEYLVDEKEDEEN